MLAEGTHGGFLWATDSEVTQNFECHSVLDRYPYRGILVPLFIVRSLREKDIKLLLSVVQIVEIIWDHFLIRKTPLNFHIWAEPKNPKVRRYSSCCWLWTLVSRKNLIEWRKRFGQLEHLEQWSSWWWTMLIRSIWAHTFSLKCGPIAAVIHTWENKESKVSLIWQQPFRETGGGRELSNNSLPDFLTAVLSRVPYR